jgi:hypothetical protein
MIPNATKTPTTMRTIFRTVLPEVAGGGGGTFRYAGLGGMGTPALIGDLACCLLRDEVTGRPE